MSYGPPTTLFVWLAALCALVTHGARIDSISATVDRKVKHETFVPLVAFKCGYRNKFLNQSGEWQDDPSSVATCLEGKLDILKYCKRSYPNRKITNIVEYSHISHIRSWCKESGHGCQKSFYVRPYRCIEGEFVADSLQVPSKCKFGHVSGRDTCEDYDHFSKTAASQCRLSVSFVVVSDTSIQKDNHEKPMQLHSFAMLEPCGLSLFRGVEYVCCPRAIELEFMNDEYAPDKVNDDEDSNEDTEGEDEEDLDDEELDDDEKDNKSLKDEEQDPYFTEDFQANEHTRYQEAQDRLEKKYRVKVTKVITEWSELFERYNKMKEKDPEGAETYKTEMTAQFRKTVSSLEDENKEERQQLESLHEERVQAALNEKKRKATHDYRAALAIQVSHGNKNNVLRTLKDYIRAEEKDRAHILKRYVHLLRSNSESAASFEPMLLHRLRYIDLRINGTLAMLRDFPDLEHQVRPVAEEYWVLYRRENTPEVDGKPVEFEESLKDNNEQLVQMYKDAAERKSKIVHVQTSFNEIAKQSNKHAEIKTKVVPLKNILVDKKKETQVVLDEDSDEDQFEEDDDADEDESEDSKTNEQIDTSPIVVNETVAAEKAAEKLAAQQKYAKAQHAHKFARERGFELPKTQPIKAFDLSKDKPVDKNEVKAEDDESNEEDDDDEADANDADDEKEETIEVDERMFVRKEIEPAYARHDKLMAEGMEPHEHVTSSFWNSQTTLLIYITMVLCVLAVAAIVIRRRPSNQGFIEVDVCNPDDYHVSKMQVNGYENPTYFYNAKP